VLSCISDALVIDGIPSDVLIVKHVIPPMYTDVNGNGTFDTTEDANGDGASDSNDDLEVGAAYIVSNHQVGELFALASDADVANIPSVTKGGEYSEAHAWQYEYYAYYIRDNGASAPPTLARKRLSANDSGAMVLQTEDVVEGVEGMRVLYGEDTDEDLVAERFVPAASVGNWNDVVAAKVHVLVRTSRPDPTYADTKTYQLGDVTVTATHGSTQSQGAALNKFRRVVVASTINLRNVVLARED
jgi:type IV pilus assembly protein PilW